MKLRLDKSATNTIVVTLTERQTLTTPNWLFVFYNEVDRSNYQSVVLVDSSTYTERYNEFTLTLPTDLDLSVTGDYLYEIWEQTDAINLDPANATTLCESGKAQVFGNNETEYFYSTT